jgi:biotin operon repressor
LIWKGVDILKSEGYVIDSVQISGFGTDTNPYTYHVIMSKAVNSTAE